MDEKKTFQRKTPRIQPSSVYLGDKYKRFYRESKLKEIATAHGLEGKSELIQKIADGDLVVINPKLQQAS